MTVGNYVQLHEAVLPAVVTELQSQRLKRWGHLSLHPLYRFGSTDFLILLSNLKISVVSETSEDLDLLAPVCLEAHTQHQALDGYWRRDSSFILLSEAFKLRAFLALLPDQMHLGRRTQKLNPKMQAWICREENFPQKEEHVAAD